MLQRAINKYILFCFIANVIIGCHYCCRLYFSQLSKPSYWPISLKSSLIYLSLSTAYFYFAVTVECTLILQSTIENVRMYYNQEKGYKRHFPYSILLSAIGTVVAILGCVISVVVYHKSQNEDVQRKMSTRSHEISLYVEEQELWTRNEKYKLNK